MELLIKFHKEYNFEGKKYTEVDLSNMENMTTLDMMEAQRAMQRAGFVSTAPQTNIAYALKLASLSTGLPIEFFNGLPMKDANKVLMTVTIFFAD